MSASSLPPELCDYTIDHLYDDAPSLKQCSLTCKSWLPAARFHLFGQAEIHSQNTCDAFYRLLSRTPEIGGLIRQLHISSPVWGPVLCAKVKAEGQQPLIMTPPLFFPFPNVRILSISALTVNMTLHNRWTEGLASVTQLTLHTCFFDNLGQFIDLYHSFPSLETLTLADTRWKSDKPIPSREHPAKAIQLRSLSLGKGLNIPCLVDWLVEQHACSTLTSLSVCCSSHEDVTALSALISQAVHLEYCEFHWFGFAPDSKHSFASVVGQSDHRYVNLSFRRVGTS